MSEITTNPARKRPRFPGLRSTRWIGLQPDAPERVEGEDDKAFARRMNQWEALEGAEIEVQFLGREAVVDLDLRFAKARAEEKTRLAKDTQGLGLDITPEGLAAYEALHLEVIAALVVGARGFDVGEVRIEDVPAAELGVQLRTCGLHHAASVKARLAQHPEAALLEQSGS